MRFYEIDPTLENYWRSIVLFGNNTASYKFALSKSLLALPKSSDGLVRLEELAEPFAMNICEHLKLSDRQTSSASSQFIEACRRYNNEQISKEALIEATYRDGFRYVIDAFHKVNRADIPVRFFEDERKTMKGIRLRDEFYSLLNSSGSELGTETESRWRLVETAWDLNISRNLISVQHDLDEELLFTSDRRHRVNITSSRDALNGYQKGKCFYSFRKISIDSGAPDLAEVDHFFPLVLQVNGVIPNLNGVWNLVLATQECNRGVNGKFARVPSLKLLERLYQRNEYLITSHHPLRETLILQTGKTPDARRDFLQNCYNLAKASLVHIWEPVEMGSGVF